MFDRTSDRSSAVGTAVWLALCFASACGSNASSGNDQGSNSSGVAIAGTKSGSAGTSSNDGSGATTCQSYTKPANGQCGGWYCEETEASLKAMVDASAKCGGDVALLCSNLVIEKVGTCARMVKSAMFAATNEQLRPMIQDCVYQDAAIKAAVPEDCLNCTIDAAACASDHCLTSCLAGDSTTCDACRLQNNCDPTVFMCGGLPSPLH